MKHDYGVKTLHFVKEDGEINYEVAGGESIFVEIDVSGFDVVGMPKITYTGKVDVEFVRFTESGFVLKITNDGKRKRKGKIIYEISGLKVWR